MKIVVCGKQVPVTTGERRYRDDLRLDREAAERVVNPLDEYAIEEELGSAAGRSTWSLSIAMTCIGYAIALSISLYILWTFGRTEGLAMTPLIKEMTVLGFPAALGAGAARLLF